MTPVDAPTFTVLLPIHRAPHLLPFAVASVQAQTRRDFELIVLCDGAPRETAAVAQALASEDARIRVKVHEKGAGRGELWRHLALVEARGRYVCQLGDDDLWLPHHLEAAALLLQEADFGHMLHVETRPDGSTFTLTGDLAHPRSRQRLLTERFNLSGPTCAAYRLAAYRALPEGWAPAPPGVWSDLHMWRKFLSRPELVCHTHFTVTAICLPNALRLDRTPEQRREETRNLAAHAQDPAWRQAYIAAAMSHAVQTFASWRRRSEEQQAEQDLARVARHQAEMDVLQTELADARQAEAKLRRQVLNVETRLAYVERSRVWRWRGRLARLFGRP